MTEREMIDRLRNTESRSKRELLDAAADYIEKRMMPDAIDRGCVNAICSYDELMQKYTAVCKERDELKKAIQRLDEDYLILKASLSVERLMRFLKMKDYEM